MTLDNDTLDDRVTAAVCDNGPIRFGALCDLLGVDPTERGKAPAWRAIDRSLQRLRKRGAIACAGTLWSAAGRRP